VQARKAGRTLEKGNKWFDFLMTLRIQELFCVWFTKHRPGDPSPYAFPGGKNGHVHTSTIRAMFTAMCTAVGLKGARFHPHALRHSFAHILLETGGTPDEVSTLLGHSSTKVTEKYYLKESAVQVQQRMLIPWMQEAAPPVTNPVPAFLDPGDQVDKKARKHARKRKRAKETLQVLKQLKCTQ
jgi:integrase